MTFSILLVDDTAEHLGNLSAALGTDFEVSGAPSADVALAAASLEPPDLIVVDEQTGWGSGVEWCRRLREARAAQAVPVLLLVNGDSAQRDAALSAGATDTLTKPLVPAEVKAWMAAHLQTAPKPDRAAAPWSAEQELRRQLRAAQNSLATINRAFVEAMMRLVVAAEMRDPYAGLHALRVGKVSGLLSRALGLPEDFQRGIEFAAPLHDVGHVVVPAGIFSKAGPLDDAKWELVRQHPAAGARILSHSRSRITSLARIIAQTHHERWDGAGYPSGLSGDRIPLSGRITAVADAYDAMRTPRAHRGAMAPDEALATLAMESGKHFDPQVVDALLKVGTRVEEARALLPDEGTGTLEKRLLSRVEQDLPEFLIVSDVTESSISA